MVTTAVEQSVSFSGLIPMRISPVSQHGQNLWKHAVEVSIDYCTSCMNGWEIHIYRLVVRFLELSGACKNHLTKPWNIK